MIFPPRLSRLTVGKRTLNPSESASGMSPRRSRPQVAAAAASDNEPRASNALTRAAAGAGAAPAGFRVERGFARPAERVLEWGLSSMCYSSAMCSMSIQAGRIGCGLGRAAPFIFRPRWRRAAACGASGEGGCSP